MLCHLVNSEQLAQFARARFSKEASVENPSVHDLIDALTCFSVDLLDTILFYEERACLDLTVYAFECYDSVGRFRNWS